MKNLNSRKAKWYSIDYTMKKYIEINGIYHEFDECSFQLAIGDSLNDLLFEYGKRHFPEEPMQEGRLIQFENYYDVDNFLKKKYKLKEILED